eukprot:JP435706.1.p1 GENE.JP435706.1~~JP435706.1.p1  ORF type:complete len:575 (-),score=77.33 JP435706.1:149-1873(-)
MVPIDLKGFLASYGDGAFCPPLDPTETVSLKLADRDFSSYFYESTFSDWMIVVGTQEFRVHRVILSRASDYFRAAFLSGLNAHNDMQNSRTVVECPPGTQEHVQTFFEFIYKGSVTLTPLNAPALLVLSDFFLVPDLGVRVWAYLQTALTTSSVMWFIKAASDCGAHRLLPLCTTCIAEVPQEFDDTLPLLPAELFLDVLQHRLHRAEFETPSETHRQQFLVDSQQQQRHEIKDRTVQCIINYLTRSQWPLTAAQLVHLVEHLPSGVNRQLCAVYARTVLHAADLIETSSDNESAFLLATVSDRIVSDVVKEWAPQLCTLTTRSLEALFSSEEFGGPELEIADVAIACVAEEHDHDNVSKILACIRWSLLSLDNIKSLCRSTPDHVSAVIRGLANHPSCKRRAQKQRDSTEILMIADRPASEMPAASNQDRIVIPRGMTSESDNKIKAVVGAYLDIFNHIAVRNGWRRLAFAAPDVLPLLETAARVVVRVRTELDKANPGLRVRQLDGSAREYLFSLSSNPNPALEGQDPEYVNLVVRNVVHYTFRDANGYVEGLSEASLDEFIRTDEHALAAT